MTNDSKNAHERRELFALAAKKHIERAKLAGNAQGVDRHLLGQYLTGYERLNDVHRECWSADD
jgi:hypothetical protein